MWFITIVQGVCDVEFDSMCCGYQDIFRHTPKKQAMCV